MTKEEAISAEPCDDAIGRQAVGKMIDNRVAIVSNYATEALQKTLDAYAENDYRLVNAMLAKNKYGIDVMYLFFTKESTVVESEETE